MRAKVLTSSLAGLILLCAVFIAVFFNTLGHVLNTWFSARGSHGPIIVVVSLYMVWIQRDALRQLTPKPRMFLGAVVTGAGCLLLALGTLSFTTMVQYAAFLMTMLGLVLLIGGMPYLKVLGLPIAYLSFTFPFFSALLERVSDQLQSFTALIAYALLKLGNIPVVLSGQTIELPSVSMEVARECNGVNHMVALVALAIPLAFWSHRTWKKRAFLIAAAVVFSQLANGVRVAAIGYLSYYVTGSRLHGPFDILYVPFVFFFGLALLLVTSSILSRVGGEGGEGIGDGTGKGIGVGAGTGERTGKGKDIGIGIGIGIGEGISEGSVRATALAVLVLAATGGFLLFMKPGPVPLSRPLASFPMTIGAWTGQDADLTEAPFTEFLATEEIKRVYKDSAGRSIKLYVGYFPAQDDENKVVGYRYDFLQRNAETVTIPVSQGAINMNRTMIPNRVGAEYVYFCYFVNNEVMTDRAGVKKAVLSDVLFKRRSNAAIIVLSYSFKGDDEEAVKAETAFISEMMDLLRKQLT